MSHHEWHDAARQWSTQRLGRIKDEAPTGTLVVVVESEFSWLRLFLSSVAAFKVLGSPRLTSPQAEALTKVSSWVVGFGVAIGPHSTPRRDLLRRVPVWLRLEHWAWTFSFSPSYPPSLSSTSLSRGLYTASSTD
jgi:hypothetical protein